MSVTNDVTNKSRLTPFSWAGLKLLLLVAILIGIYKGYKTIYPDIPGYCYSQKRFLSDDEFMQIAIRRVLDTPPARRPDIDGSEASIREFLKNPKCCRVYKVEDNTEEAKKNNVDAWPWHADIFMTFQAKEKTPGSPSFTSQTRLDECGNSIFDTGSYNK